MLKLIISSEHVLRTLVIRVDFFFFFFHIFVIIHRRNYVVQFEGHRRKRDSHLGMDKIIVIIIIIFFSFLFN